MGLRADDGKSASDSDGVLPKPAGKPGLDRARGASRDGGREPGHEGAHDSGRERPAASAVASAGEARHSAQPWGDRPIRQANAHHTMVPPPGGPLDPGPLVPESLDDFDPAPLYERVPCNSGPCDPLSEALGMPGVVPAGRIGRRTTWRPAAELDGAAGDDDLYAALDLGTNNCRLLVAEPNRASFRVIDAFSRIVRLGEGMSGSGRLSDAAQSRAIEALHVCRSKLEARGIRRARLVATEACRIAENGADFIARVEAETGLALEVVTRETEARLAVAGCANLVDWQADGVVLFDIGGGSSELVWLDLTRQRAGMELARHIRAWTSLPVGVVTLSERHGGVSVDSSTFEAMVDDVDSMLHRLVEGEALSEALDRGNFHMLGTSGTVTTLAGVHLGLRRYDRRRVDGIWLGACDVDAMIGRLLAMSFQERVANPCIGLDRADLVLAGCAILEAIRRRWPCDRLRVADRGLREGILTELMAADGVWNKLGPEFPGFGQLR
ncbi:MAG: Ppx/GppA phosphatase family protein [Ancalomicrobiaceae bacterium]|nr:Ppx/GppA phosphatase family protein [Ancalomicrobiaceae bacterium]